MDRAKLQYPSRRPVYRKGGPGGPKKSSQISDALFVYCHACVRESSSPSHYYWLLHSYAELSLLGNNFQNPSHEATLFERSGRCGPRSLAVGNTVFSWASCLRFLRRVLVLLIAAVDGVRDPRVIARRSSAGRRGWLRPHKGLVLPIVMKGYEGDMTVDMRAHWWVRVSGI